MSQRTFAIGDIHGCLLHLERLLGTIDYAPSTHRLIFLGDYVDRGPDSAGVIDRILELKEANPEIVTLMGNHERMFLDFLDGVHTKPFLYNGGRQTLSSYQRREGTWQKIAGRATIPDHHVAFLRSLPLIHTTPTHIFVHAGLRPGVPLDEQSEDDLLWIREAFFTAPHTRSRTIVFGHSPMVEPFHHDGMVGIDTGACYNGPLTAYEVDTDQFVSVVP
ncbi:MAG TPA: metallophosphoesterase family protein [bacterium]|jgi:serine/threonine protein phosphatase 1